MYVLTAQIWNKNSNQHQELEILTLPTGPGTRLVGTYVDSFSTKIYTLLLFGTFGIILTLWRPEVCGFNPCIGVSKVSNIP